MGEIHKNDWILSVLHECYKTNVCCEMDPSLVWSSGDQMRQSRAVTSQPAAAAHHRTPALLTYFGISGPQTTWSTPTPYTIHPGFFMIFEKKYRSFLTFPFFLSTFVI